MSESSRRTRNDGARFSTGRKNCSGDIHFPRGQKENGNGWALVHGLYVAANLFLGEVVLDGEEGNSAMFCRGQLTREKVCRENSNKVAG